MKFLPIHLGVRRSSDDETREKAPSKSQADKALRRDDYTCRFCGFRSEQYQRVIPADNGKLVTSCTFCEQCLYLERAGITGAGALLWLPEIGQAELNHIARAIYIAGASQEKLAKESARAIEALQARRSEAKKRLGSDDPLLLATALHESLTEKEYARATDKLAGIRLLPVDKHMARGARGDADQFPAMIKYWCSDQGPYAELPVAKWGDVLKAASAASGHA
jgi:intracellular multiplication protein IcmJ